MSTEQLRDHFLVTNLMNHDSVTLHYSHYDRMIIGGVSPIGKMIELPNPGELKAEYFLERREMGIINIGGPGKIITDKKEFNLNKLDALYIGKGTRKVKFKSTGRNNPACFYILSAPAHHVYPSRSMTKEKATPVKLGSMATSNQRTVYKYIYGDGIKSSQLVMGLTILDEGNVWNSVPPHTHSRRMEAYFYFDVPDQQRIFHFMGETNQTRHIVMKNHEAVISPPWSTHFGCGTSNYGFIWGMAGENQVYNDMDTVAVAEIL